MTSAEASSALPPFILPTPFENDALDSWGPVSTPTTLSFCLNSMELYPFEQSSKQERLGRVCDFTYATSQRVTREGRTQGQEDGADFQLVDTRPVRVNRYQRGYQQRRPQQSRRQNLQQQQQIQQQQLHAQQLHMLNQQNRGGPHNPVQTQRQYQQQQAQRQQQWQRNNRQRQLAEWSIEPQHGWNLISTEQLSILPRMSLDISKITCKDIEWRGELRVYEKAMDRVVPKSPLPLSATYVQNKSFYWPGTADDSILVNAFDSDPNVRVAATDQILACLMSAAQSRLSWHLVFHKADGKIFIDKHNGTSIDLMTVDETSKEPPLSDHPIRINRPAELGAEALKINQNFSQQSSPYKTFQPASFVDETDEPASRAYRYRLITLPGKPYDSTHFNKEPVTMIVRSEIDAVMPSPPHSYVSIKALNEANLNRGGKTWRSQLESQQGALIAQETKNNHCKVGKWVSQALISGCDYLKIGFVTRNSLDNNQRHVILNILTYKVKELGVQIGLHEDNVWGIVRHIIDVIMAQRDGKYILVKDPVKPEMKLYCVSTEVIEDIVENEKDVETSKT